MIHTLFGAVEQEPTLLEKLKSGVQKTRAGLVSALEDAIQGKKEIDADLLDELEFTLISADIGVRTTGEILEPIRQRPERHPVRDAAEIRGPIPAPPPPILQRRQTLLPGLEKLDPAAKKVTPGAPHEVLLVLDATTGQNGLEQARKFTETSGVTGIVLTKLDGTAKGGIIIAIAHELNLPIRYVGIGEKLDDLLPFDSEKFIQSLFEK